MLNIKKLLFLMVMLLFVFSTATYAQTFCEVNDVKQVLKKVLFLRYTDSSSSPLVLDEVRDLLVFYLGIGAGVSTVDCSVTGSKTNKKISDIVSLGGNATNQIPTCSDGTEYGECSSFKPKYCYAGSLLHRCNYCTCPSPSSCTTSGKCEAVTQNITCSSGSDCGTSSFTGDYYCSNNYITRNQINYTCLNPGTINSSCVVSNSFVALSYCNLALSQVCVGGNSSCQTVKKELSIEIVQITTDTASQIDPSIYGNKIVWLDRRNEITDIYMYDLSTGQEKRLTTVASLKDAVDIYNDKIVWQDFRNGNWDIYMYDLSTSQESRITTNTRHENSPSIFGNRIVWHDQRTTTHDIYMYDLSTGQESRITTNLARPANPSIHNDKIVWQDSRNGDFDDVYMYDLSTGQESRITPDTSGHYIPTPYSGSDNIPSIYGNKIVWFDYRNTNPDIFMYDFSTGQETQIATVKATLHSPPTINNDKIVWADDRNGNVNIYMYDLSTGQETQVTTNSGGQGEIHDNKIVFTDDRNGNLDIYMAIIS